MSLRFVLQLGWRCFLAIAMAVTPWSAQVRACAMAASAPQTRSAVDARVAEMPMPCRAAVDGTTGRNPHGGAPHPHCPQGDCDNSACVGHCMVLATLPAAPSLAIARAPMIVVPTETSMPDRPPQERLRPPIA